MKSSLSLVMLLCSITFAQKMIDDEFKLSGDLRSPKFQYDHAQILHGENAHVISIDQVATSSGPISPRFIFKGSVNNANFVEDTTIFRSKVNGSDLSSVSVNDLGQFYVSSFNASIEGLWRGILAYLNQVRSAQYEIRFGTDDVGLAFDLSTGKIIRVPFTAWDIGGTINDPADDQMILVRIFNDGEQDARWGIRDIISPWTANPAKQSDRIYLYHFESSTGPEQVQQAFDVQQMTGVIDIRLYENMFPVSNEILSRMTINSLDSNPLTTINTLSGLPRPRAGTVIRWTFYVPLGFLVENLYAAAQTPFSYAPKAKGTPKPSLTAVNLPSGMNLNSSGVLEWTPSTGQDGNHEIVVSATNEQGTVQGIYPIWVDLFPWQYLNHDNNNISCSVFNNGYFGQSLANSSTRIGQGIRYFGLQGLYTAQLIVAASPSQVSARFYSNINNHRYATGGPVEPVPSLIPYFTQSFRSEYNDRRAPSPIGVQIVQRSYSRTSTPDDDYVVLDYHVVNTTSQTLDGVYVGLFADLDVGNAQRNLCGLDLSRKLCYVYEAAAALNPNYYGMSILRGELSGCNFDLYSSVDSIIYEGMRTIGVTPTDTTDSYVILSAGPYSIPAGESVRIAFAIVCGTSLADLLNNTDAARAVNLNRKPLLQNLIENKSLLVGGNNFVRNLTANPPVFIDLDYDPLTFNSNSSNSAVAQATISGSTLTVRPLAIGTASITVNADDGKGGTETTSFVVTVAALPTAVTETPTDITPVSAMLHGTVDPKGYTTQVFFEYGLPTSYGDTAWAMQNPVTGNTSVAVAAVITDLAIAGTYHYRTVASNANGKTSGSDQQVTTLSYPANYTVNTTIPFANLSSPADYQPTDYRLIGLPGEDKNTFITTLLKGKQNVDWQLFWDSGATVDYLIDYDGGADFKLMAGRAFWIIYKGDLIIDNVSIPSTPLKSNDEVEVILHAGWNLITNPFDVNISWSKVQNANSLTAPIWTYTGSGGYQVTDNFVPLQGYYFYNSTGVPTLRIPFRALFTKPVNKENIDWQVQIVLNSPKGDDASTWFGVAPKAVSAWDDLDYFKPRAVGAIPNVYFEHRDWNENCYTFARDMRPQFKVIENWTFRVQVPGQQESRLTFENLENIPVEYEIYLVNTDQANYQNLRDNKKYTFKPVKETSEFKVIVGEKEKVLDEVSKVIPLRFALGQNFPNPFNPVTTIPVAIPEESKVIITIFNILGQEISVLYDGTLPVGRHYFNWSGTNFSGDKMPSGIYLYRLSTDKGTNLTGKMVMIK